MNRYKLRFCNAFRTVLIVTPLCSLFACKCCEDDKVNNTTSNPQAGAAEREKKMTFSDLNAEQVLAALPPAVSITPLAEARRLAADFIQAGRLVSCPTEQEEIWFGQLVSVSQSLNAGVGYVFLKLKPAAPLAANRNEHSSTLPCSGFLSFLTTESGSEEAEAGLLLQAARSGSLAPSVGALRFVRGASAQNGYAPLVLTTGRSAVLREAHPYWLRMSGTRLLLMAVPKDEQPNGKRPVSGTGHYAELWRLQ
jgi:hypothetical protein